MSSLHRREKKSTSKKGEQKKGFFLIKSIRQYPDPYAFWRFEAMSLTLTDKTPDYERNRPLRFGGEEKPFTLRIDGPQKVKGNPLYKKYDENKKKWNYSKHKSLTAVSNEHELCPAAFSFNKEKSSDSVEVGYMLPAKPDYALERRILQNSGGTIHRNFRYGTEAEAKMAWDQGLFNRTIFQSLDQLAKRGDPTKFNEVMAHVKWGPKARIAYFKNNLPSKLRAISLARDMSLRLRRQRIENGQETDAPVPTDAKNLPQVNICSYLPKQDNKSADIIPYLLLQQERDIQLGLQSDNQKTRAFARFIQLQRNNFRIKKEYYYNEQTLEIFIKLAADLTYESSVLFFQNFFKKNSSIFQTLLLNKPHLLREIFRCVPPDKRSTLIYPFLTTPKLRGYYLHNLLKFDCMEHDTEEFLNQLESGKKIDFKVLGEYKSDNRRWKIVQVQDRNKNTPLHLAASRNKKKAVKLLLNNGASINATNKQGKTPLDLAWEGGHKDIVDTLLQRGGRFSIETDLHLAVKKGDYKLVRSLINDNKAIINSKNINGATLLHMAAKEGELEIAKFLVEKDRNMVHERDDDGLTPLHYAISSNSSQVSEFLIKKGANIIPLHHAISSNRLEMAKLLIEKGADVNSVDNDSKKPLGWAVFDNKLVAADLILRRNGTFNSETDERRCSLLHAIRNKNWAVVDFLLARGDISFLALMPASFKQTTVIYLIVVTLSGAGYTVYKNINLPISQDFSKIIDDGSIVSILLVGLAMLLLIIFLDALLNAKKNYDDVRKRVEDKKTVLAKKNSLRALGIREPSVEAVLKHFDSLSLSEQTVKLIQIANVDAKLSLYVIIRLFNSDVEKASNILWEVADSKNTRKNFCDLFENHTSDELEVIVGCVTQKIKEENMDQAFSILNMFSEPIKEKILERLDPAYRSLKKYFITPQDSSIGDQKRRVNVDSQADQMSDPKQHSPTLGRDTFFYHDDPPLDVKDAKKSSEFAITAETLDDTGLHRT